MQVYAQQGVHGTKCNGTGWAEQRIASCAWLPLRRFSRSESGSITRIVCRTNSGNCPLTLVPVTRACKGGSLEVQAGEVTAHAIKALHTTFSAVSSMYLACIIPLGPSKKPNRVLPGAREFKKSSRPVMTLCPPARDQLTAQIRSRRKLTFTQNTQYVEIETLQKTSKRSCSMGTTCKHGKVQGSRL